MKARAAAVAAYWLWGACLLGSARVPAPPPPGLEALDRAWKAGDHRKAREEALALLAAGPSRERLDQIAARALSNTWYWNSGLPAWQRDALERWTRAWGLDGEPRWRFLGEPVAVTFTFAGDGPRYYLHGDWDEAGRYSDLDGWKPAALERGGGGVWTLRRRLRVSRAPQVYHAVVRTEPWPRGRAVGWASFPVSGPGRVAIPASSSPEPRPAARAAGPARVGLSVLGLDAAAWHLILPWIHRDLLPNFARLWREGAAASLVAYPGEEGWYPSGPNIHSAMTGRAPAAHGLGGGMAGGNFDTNWSRRASPLWRIFADAGRKAAVVGVWGTFPPDELPGGALVSDAFLALRARERLSAVGLAENGATMAFASEFGITPGFVRRLFRVLGWLEPLARTTFPDALARELSAALPPGALSGSLAEIARLFDELAAKSAEVLLRREGLDLFCAYLIGIDGASHAGWLEDPENLLAAYLRADELLGRLLENSRHVLVWSDHGFGPVDMRVAGEAKRGNSHMADALLAAWGPDVAPGRVLEEGSIMDVAPTALYLADLPAGADMEGRLAAGLIRPEILAARPPAFVPSHGPGGSALRRFWRALR